jgi:hypothetical protein
MINHELIPETTTIGKWMKTSEESAAKPDRVYAKKEYCAGTFFLILF